MTKGTGAFVFLTGNQFADNPVSSGNQNVSHYQNTVQENEACGIPTRQLNLGVNWWQFQNYLWHQFLYVSDQVFPLSFSITALLSMNLDTTFYLLSLHINCVCSSNSPENGQAFNCSLFIFIQVFNMVVIFGQQGELKSLICDSN